MTVWLIEPHDPLIFRDGRPFGPTPGAQAQSLIFPFPSTIAGGVRSRAALDSNGAFRLNPRQYRGPEQEAIKQQLQRLTTKLTIRGPLLVQIPEDRQDITPENWLVPAPGDALILVPELDALTHEQHVESHGSLRRLVPLSHAENSYHDLRRSSSHGKQASPDLFLVGMPHTDPGKPHEHAPRYWTWQALQDWLYQPDDRPVQIVDLASLGHNGPEHEQRVHVSMDFRTRAGKAEALFATAGLEFTYNEHSKGRHLANAQSLGLAVFVEDQTRNHEFPVHPGPACLGSERRIVNWRSSMCEVPTCPKELIDEIVNAKACRMILLTPAHFKSGYLPDWSELLAPDKWLLQPQIKAIAIDRPQVVSGWDIVAGRPKKTRRLAPAGTVLFLSFEDVAEEKIREWIDLIWMQCVSDDLQDRCDGYGLVVLGTWSGQPVPMQGGRQA